MLLLLGRYDDTDTPSRIFNTAGMAVLAEFASRCRSDGDEGRAFEHAQTPLLAITQLVSLLSFATHFSLESLDDPSIQTNKQTESALVRDHWHERRIKYGCACSSLPVHGGVPQIVVPFERMHC